MVPTEQPITKQQIQRLFYAFTIFFVIAFIGNSLILWQSFYYRYRFLNEGVKTSAQVLGSKRISPWQVQLSLQVSSGGGVPFTTNYDVGCSAKAGCGVSNYSTGSSLPVYYISQPGKRIEFAEAVENAQLEVIWLGIDMFLALIAILFYHTGRRLGVVVDG